MAPNTHNFKTMLVVAVVARIVLVAVQSENLMANEPISKPFVKAKSIAANDQKADDFIKANKAYIAEYRARVKEKADISNKLIQENCGVNMAERPWIKNDLKKNNNKSWLNLERQRQDNAIIKVLAKIPQLPGKIVSKLSCDSACGIIDTLFLGGTDEKKAAFGEMGSYLGESAIVFLDGGKESVSTLISELKFQMNSDFEQNHGIQLSAGSSDPYLSVSFLGMFQKRISKNSKLNFALIGVPSSYSPDVIPVEPSIVNEVTSHNKASLCNVIKSVSFNNFMRSPFLSQNQVVSQNESSAFDLIYQRGYSLKWKNQTFDFISFDYHIGDLAFASPLFYLSASGNEVGIIGSLHNIQSWNAISIDDRLYIQTQEGEYAEWGTTIYQLIGDTFLSIHNEYTDHGI
ncbi:MAG: hypothetical protein COT74_01760 [Bdellovibrionales bacterium CG10_big_fil_rev_8_21_14_0_10_45_34]|nr:MAG: hypothetical protein COT74_01760 [Bdellovibrionales bacterium CG10_big_fil_rev_8_21_14_0_10_45_34]